MILVPLVSVLYFLALSSFAVAAYYGFMLSRFTRSARAMVMITKDGPTSIVAGVLLVSLSQIPSLLMSLMAVSDSDIFVVPSAILMVGAALMFAMGFHKVYAVYLNERLKMKVNSALDELLETEATEPNSKFRGGGR